MQYLIGIGLVSLGVIAGIALSAFLNYGKVEEMTRQILNEIINDLKKGKIKIEDLEHII
jgi:hypothetical protein